LLTILLQVSLFWQSNTDAEGLESAYEMTPLTIQVLDGKSTHALRSTLIHIHSIELEDLLLQRYHRRPHLDLHGLWENFAFSDGYAVSLNEDDQLVYCIGKGPSETTVEASPRFQCLAAAY